MGRTHLVAELRGDCIQVRNLLCKGGLHIVRHQLPLRPRLAGRKALLGLLQGAPGMGGREGGGDGFRLLRQSMPGPAEGTSGGWRGTWEG